jgi:hypothetical protein
MFKPWLIVPVLLVAGVFAFVIFDEEMGSEPTEYQAAVLGAIEGLSARCEPYGGPLNTQDSADLSGKWNGWGDVSIADNKATFAQSHMEQAGVLTFSYQESLNLFSGIYSDDRGLGPSGKGVVYFAPCGDAQTLVGYARSAPSPQFDLGQESYFTWTRVR